MEIDWTTFDLQSDVVLVAGTCEEFMIGQLETVSNKVDLKMDMQMTKVMINTDEFSNIQASGHTIE